MNLVVYESKNGHTKQYAQWIAEALDCQSKPLSETTKNEWNHYDLILFGGGIYMGKIRGLKKALKLRNRLPLVLFACGANQGTEADLAYVKSRNLSPALQSKLPFFFLPSTMDLDHMKGFLKWLMKKIVAMIEKKPDPSEEDRKFLNMMKPKEDRMDKAHLDDLLNWVQDRSV